MKNTLILFSFFLFSFGRANEIPQAEIVKITNPTFKGKKLAVSIYCSYYETYDLDGSSRMVRTCGWRTQQPKHICRFMGLGDPAPD